MQRVSPALLHMRICVNISMTSAAVVVWIPYHLQTAMTITIFKCLQVFCEKLLYSYIT